MFGSIVQNGKLAASMPALVNALKSVDLPTLGRPTMPHLKPICLPFSRLLADKSHSSARFSRPALWQHITE
ncbi:hypothetical protein SOHN41_00912 [Shewanella sp. HN-41]|nr:hypothetical protein SOHN41_00912 [Shewanella sp. HN-41]